MAVPYESMDYWIKRELEHMTAAASDGYFDNYYKRLDSIYLAAEKDAEDAAVAFFDSVMVRDNISFSNMTHYSERAASEAQMQQYAAWAKEYVATKDFSFPANMRMKHYNTAMKLNRDDLLKAQINMMMLTYTDRAAKEGEVALLTASIAEYQRRAGILGETVPSPEQLFDMANVVANGSFREGTFSSRIWANHDMLIENLNHSLMTSLIRGVNPKVMAVDFRRLFRSTTYEAERLARTELQRVQTATQKIAFDRYGYEQYIFVAEPDACEHCLALDDGTPKLTKKMAPGINAAPIHPNCRCSVVPFMDRDESMAKIEELTGVDMSSRKRAAIEKAYPLSGIDKIVRDLMTYTPPPPMTPIQALQKKSLVYSSFDEFVKNEKTALQEARQWDPDSATAIYYDARYNNSLTELKELDQRDALDIIWENFDQGTIDGWFREANSDYKPRIESKIINNPKLRNATLNTAWRNYMFETGNDISFTDFLNKELPVYRGGNLTNFIDTDNFVSFSYNKEAARKFGGNVISARVKAIDTLGSINNIGEAEVMVPRKLLDKLITEDKKTLAGILNTMSKQEQLDYLAKNTLKRAAAIEPAVTQKLQDLAAEVHATLEGLDFRLKSESSLSRKIEKVAVEQKMLFMDAPDAINDALRYTALLDYDTFVDSYERIKQELITEGYEIVKVKNTWYDGSEYKGINTSVAKDGYVFELQYHTPESFALKNGELHTLYEEARELTTSLERKAELKAMMDKLTLSIHNPVGIERVN